LTNWKLLQERCNNRAQIQHAPENFAKNLAISFLQWRFLLGCRIHYYARCLRDGVHETAHNIVHGQAVAHRYRDNSRYRFFKLLLGHMVSPEQIAAPFLTSNY
jgi:hypothetical protein